MSDEGKEIAVYYAMVREFIDSEAVKQEMFYYAKDINTPTAQVPPNKCVQITIEYSDIPE